MAFKKELVEYILPFPENLVAHDQWIGLIAESRQESEFINEQLIKLRRHSSNVSNKLPLNKKIQFRLNLLLRYLNYKSRRFRNLLK